jgi:hypothetical protein
MLLSLPDSLPEIDDSVVFSPVTIAFRRPKTPVSLSPDPVFDFVTLTIMSHGGKQDASTKEAKPFPVPDMQQTKEPPLDHLCLPFRDHSPFRDPGPPRHYWSPHEPPPHFGGGTMPAPAVHLYPYRQSYGGMMPGLMPGYYGMRYCAWYTWSAADATVHPYISAHVCSAATSAATATASCAAAA